MSVTAATGLVCTFIACILLIVVSISAVTSKTDDISFLNVRSAFDVVHFGVFGYSNGGESVGYHFPPGLVPDMSPFTGSYFHILTGFLILHPIAAGLCALAFVFGICGLSNCIAGIFMTVLNAISCVVTLIALCIDLGFWIHVRDEIRDQGVQAELANCMWLTLAAFIALLFGVLFGACGSIGNLFGGLRDRVRRRY